MIRYLAFELVQGVATLVGWPLLAVLFALQAQSWAMSPATSIKDGRAIDRWRWHWIDAIYGNPEDGPSGRYALIGEHGDQPYMPNALPCLRAWCWCAWRNSCDALKYRFADPKGFAVRRLFWRVEGGYQIENGFNVPVVRFV